MEKRDNGTDYVGMAAYLNRSKARQALRYLGRGKYEMHKVDQPELVVSEKQAAKIARRKARMG